MDGEGDADERSNPRDDGTFSPWGYIGSGLVLVVGGALIVLASSDASATALDNGEFGVMLGLVLGVLLLVAGLLVSLIGAIAEGVRIGTVAAHQHAARHERRSIDPRGSDDVLER